MATSHSGVSEELLMARPYLSVAFFLGFRQPTWLGSLLRKIVNLLLLLILLLSLSLFLFFYVCSYCFCYSLALLSPLPSQV